MNDNFDIEHYLAQALVSIGALTSYWSDPAVNTRSKYLIFCAIPVNMLLWGCENVALRETLLQKLQAFFHQSIQRILSITITKVIDKLITNNSFRVRFCHIPSVQNQIAKRQLTFFGKIARNKDNQIPTRFLTAWCNIPRKSSALLQTNKKHICKNIQLLISAAANDDRLSSWLKCALNSAYWSQLGNRPTSWGIGISSSSPPLSSVRSNAQTSTSPRSDRHHRPPSLTPLGSVILPWLDRTTKIVRTRTSIQKA